MESLMLKTYINNDERGKNFDVPRVVEIDWLSVFELDAVSITLFSKYIDTQSSRISGCIVMTGDTSPSIMINSKKREKL
jgi:hypothetical protein